MSVTIQPCRFGQLLDIVDTLAVGHWQETEAQFSGLPPSPNLELYDALINAHALIVLGAFDGDTLVGYATAMLFRHPHYEMTLCQHDLLYLMPAYRQGSAGLRLMQAVEEEARERGAFRIAWHAKPGSTFDHLLQRKGYSTEETIYQKEL